MAVLIADGHARAVAAAVVVVGGVGAVVVRGNVMGPGVVDGDGLSVCEGDPAAAVERVLHGDTTAGQVVVQVEGFTLFEVNGDAILIVGIAAAYLSQVTTDHQHRRHGCRVCSEGVSDIRQCLVTGVVAGAGEADRSGAGEVGASWDPAGVERGR